MEKITNEIKRELIKSERLIANNKYFKKAWAGGNGIGYKPSDLDNEELGITLRSIRNRKDWFNFYLDLTFFIESRAKLKQLNSRNCRRKLNERK